jgi:type IV secretory pathway VirB4 component
MIKTLKTLFKQDKERFVVPKSVQSVIPIKTIWEDGIFLVGKNKYAKTFKFEDINYAVASREDKEAMFLEYSELLNALDSGATTKITINNRRLNKADFEQTILIPMADDELDKYRKEYNKMLLDKATGANSIVQDKYVTVSVSKKNIEEARNYFARVGADLIGHFSRLGSKCAELDATERLRIFHDFFRTGEETAFQFDMVQSMRKGHDFKDFICPDTFEFEKDYFRIGDRYGRVIFLREYAAYIKDSMVAELCELNRNMMLSVDVVPVPTDEAVREVENRLLGVETNITNWQRKQNQNNNFSAVIPYDLEQQRKESKEFLDDLTTRDQRMMFAVLTMVHTADTKEQLDNDTEALLTTARKHLCQFAVLKYQQMDGLNTALPYGVRKIDAVRTLTTESLAVFIPFRVQEIYHEDGVYYGQNVISKNMIIANRRHLLNGNSFILGVSGAGKSFTAKEEMTNIILTDPNADIIVIDPEREYSPLVKAMQGEVIHISATSENHINAMDMNSDYGDGANPVILKSEFILSLCEQLIGGTNLGAKQKSIIDISATSENHINAMDMNSDYGDGANPVILKSEFILSLCEQLIGGTNLGAKQKSIIDRCTATVYRHYQQSGYMGTPPTLQDFREELLKQNEPEAKEIALAIELFTDGSLNTFAKLTNVDTHSRLICYDILDLGKQLQPIGMLVVLDSILNRITANRAKGRNTFIFIDEIYLLFQHEYSANFLFTLWKRVRKYGAYATGITQNVDDLLQSHTARTMLANSEFIIMLNQASTDRIELAKLLNISDLQLSYITNVGAGQGLLKVGSSLVPFVNKFPRNTELYKLMTTKFGEV